MHRHTTRTTSDATKLSVEIRRMGLTMNIAKTSVMTTIDVNNVLIEDIEGYVFRTTQKPQRKEPGQRDTTKNRGRLGDIRHTPGYLQKQPCRLSEHTGVQLQCDVSYVLWCRDPDTDQTSTEQTCGRTDQHGNKYAQYPILGQGEDNRPRYNRQCDTNEMVLGRARQPPQRRPIDLACHQLETI